MHLPAFHTIEVPIDYSVWIITWAPSRIVTEETYWLSQGSPIRILSDTIHPAHLKWWLRSWKPLRGHQIFEVSLRQPLGAPFQSSRPWGSTGLPSRAFLFWHITDVPVQRKKMSKGILHLEDMFLTQQNIFVMNVTYVVLFLCLAGDKKNRSNAKMKTKWSI